MVIVWNAKAKEELRKLYQYILKDSYQNGLKVREDIIKAVLSLAENPESYQLDKYKPNNDGTWRAFEIHRYRISYRVKKGEIRIIRIRHTSRSALAY